MFITSRTSTETPLSDSLRGGRSSSPPVFIAPVEVPSSSGMIESVAPADANQLPSVVLPEIPMPPILEPTVELSMLDRLVVPPEISQNKSIIK